ncbi:unnamed protein product [Mesocestoides corti]|uniref:OCIA domain-containing protein n=1 Tax=Mesocestoides corti TaxID=53468 RepID=A0A0R3U804_MESCO|nr:unnamed protein product [Mesocestoides corti]
MNKPDACPPELSMEDLATFRRCRKESFWRGSVPMIIGASFAVGFAQSRGFFANRPRLLIPSYILAGLFGYIGGKVSYIGKCKRMFLELNDSRVKDFLLGNQPRMPFPQPPNFSSASGWSRQGDDGPILVDTPTTPQRGSGKPECPLTYADRRKYYGQKHLQPQQPSPPPSSQQDDSMAPPQLPSQSPSNPSSSEYFNTERPLSSFMSDDEYRPRD